MLVKKGSQKQLRDASAAVWVRDMVDLTVGNLEIAIKEE